MLSSEKWSEAGLARPSLEDFIAWLRTRDPAEEYPYGSLKQCAVCQYMGNNFIEGRFWLNPVIMSLNDLATPKPWTFGALLERAVACRDQSSSG